MNRKIFDSKEFKYFQPKKLLLSSQHRIPDPDPDGAESTESVNPGMDLEYFIFKEQGRRLPIELKRYCDEKFKG
jgi:hypothetical protein